MTKTKSYKSDIKAAIHQTASDLYEAGMLDKQSMRRFDASCLTAVQEFTGEEIRALREREEVSQAVFAHYLNVSKDSGEPVGARPQTSRWPNPEIAVSCREKRTRIDCLIRSNSASSSEREGQSSASVKRSGSSRSEERAGREAGRVPIVMQKISAGGFRPLTA